MVTQGTYVWRGLSALVILALACINCFPSSPREQDSTLAQDREGA